MNESKNYLSFKTEEKMIGMKKSKFISSILLFFGLVFLSACSENVAAPVIYDENEDQFEDEVTPDNNVRYEFEDGQSIIDEGFVTASIGAPEWGDFEITIRFDELYSESANIILFEGCFFK